MNIDTIQGRKKMSSRTGIQKLGDRGEEFALREINKASGCLNCKHKRGKLKTLLGSFAAVDLVCEFCGQMYQVKTTKVENTSMLPTSVRGAQYPPLKDRMDAGIFHPLVIVLFKKGKNGPDGLTRTWKKTGTVWYLSPDLVEREMYYPYETTLHTGRELVMTTINLSRQIRNKFIQIK